MALALLTRTPSNPTLEIKGTLYGIEEIARGYLADRRLWADEGGPTKAGEGDPRFPTLVDLMLHHGGSINVTKRSCAR